MPTLAGDFKRNFLKIMSSNSETGHAVNVGNFKLLITSCTYFGLPYNLRLGVVTDYVAAIAVR